MFEANVTHHLHTLRDYLRYALSCMHKAQIFCGHGTDNYWDEAVHLVLSALHLPFDSDPQLLDARLTDNEKAKVMHWLRRRVERREPLAYISGRAWFMGLEFEVNRDVLIPRSPFAELLDQAMEPWLGGRAVNRVLDLCSGSGCIGIASAMVFDTAEVDLADISPAAVELSQRNIAHHHLEQRVTARQSDLFAALPTDPYDLIISNPPYVDEADLASMPEEFRHEPLLGLEAGKDGLDIVKRLLLDAPDYLAEDGLLAVEVGNCAEALMAQYPELECTWPTFEHGGHGIFIVEAQALKRWRAQQVE